ncbi:hypothetical protein Tco_0660064 [Tanacetum coccineum]
MLNPNPDTTIDSILNLNTKSTYSVDVPVTMNVEIPPSSVITLPLPPIPHIQPQQQTPFEDRVKALEYDFSEFKQTNLFAEAISSILSVGIKRLQGDSLSYYCSVVNTACAQLQLLSDYYCWKDYADRDETKD